MHVELEGESSFLNILVRAIEVSSYNEIFETPVNGLVFIAPSTRDSAPRLVVGQSPGRMKTLEDIPSPYTTGLLDQFFDGRLTPFLETNRGCPFKCAFCHTGSDYFNKINHFSDERVRAEISYIAPRVAEHGIVNLHIADTNFGMYPRDKSTCEALYEAQQAHGWPQQIMATTGKNSKERVINITSILGKLFSVNMSVQSMDQKVLENINRSNIRIDDYIKINEELQRNGRSTKAELIIGLPGETKDSFIKGVESVVESGASSTTIYTLMLLHGTEFKDPTYRALHGIKGKYRIVPLNYGEYDGYKVFDYEEVGVENNTMLFEDYVYLRSYALLVEVLMNGRPFEPLFQYGKELGVSRANLLRRLHENIDSAPDEVQEISNQFLAETKSELWDSEAELVRHYSKEENYQSLVNGEVGGNLIFKYKAKSLVYAIQQWIDYLAVQLSDVISNADHDEKTRKRPSFELEALSRFSKHRLTSMLDARGDTSPIVDVFHYQIPNWLAAKSDDPLEAYELKESAQFVFEYTSQQLQMREDVFSRYGTDTNALSKIVTRVSNIESLFRKVRCSGIDSLSPTTKFEDSFTRYALSN